MRCIDADALEKEGWSLHRTIRVDKNTEEYQTKPIRQVPTIEPRCEACEAFNKTRLLIPQPQQQKGKLMRRRTFEEMITYFNQTVSDMDIDRKYKITLLGIVTALLQKHDEDVAQIEPQRKKGRWIKKTIKKKIENDYSCSECGRHVSVMRGYDVRLVYPFCHCGADMTEGEG